MFYSLEIKPSDSCNYKKTNKQNDSKGVPIVAMTAEKWLKISYDGYYSRFCEDGHAKDPD